MKLLITDSKNKCESIYIMESDNVAKLKEEIKSKYNVIGDIELVFNGNILMDNESLVEKGIRDGNTINFLGQFNAGIL
jgi:ribosomal protein S13